MPYHRKPRPASFADSHFPFPEPFPNPMPKQKAKQTPATDDQLTIGDLPGWPAPRTQQIAQAPFVFDEATEIDRAKLTAAQMDIPVTTYPCSKCGRHAFSEPTVCIWCAAKA